MSVNCITDIKNLSAAKCVAEYGVIKSFWADRDPDGVTFANALLEATWVGKTQAAKEERLFIPVVTNRRDVVRNVEDAVINTSSIGSRWKVRNGKADYVFTLNNLKDAIYNAIKSMDGSQMYCYFITDEHIIGSDDGVNFKGVPCDIFVTEPKSPENEDGNWSIDIHVFIIPTKNYFTKVISPFEQTAKWLPSEIVGIVELTGEVISSSAAGSNMIVDIETAQESTEVADLTVAGDFIITNVGTGATQNPSTISSVNNRYTLGGLTIVAATTYSISRKTADLATQKSYEWNDAITFIAGA